MTRGELLAFARAQNGSSVREAAVAAGISETELQLIEKGEREVSRATLRKLSRIFGASYPDVLAAPIKRRAQGRERLFTRKVDGVRLVFSTTASPVLGRPALVRRATRIELVTLDKSVCADDIVAVAVKEIREL